MVHFNTIVKKVKKKGCKTAGSSSLYAMGEVFIGLEKCSVMMASGMVFRKVYPLNPYYRKTLIMS